MITPGTSLGPYDIEAELGAGGAGHVFKARDTRLGRSVAIKVLAPTVDARALRERLQREARALSQLAHPHICTLYDIGATPEGVSYLVMEFLEGETLEFTLGRGSLPLPQALTYAAQIADAIGAAHRAGIVHGDLKPGNIMVTTRSSIKLLDFGLATERAPVVSSTSSDQVTASTVISQSAGVEGTLQYLSPEQVEGRPADELSDIFACGAVIYEMFTGRKAFEGQTPANVIAAILREEVPPVSRLRADAPPALDRIVAACLVKARSERWQNAADLARELRWIDPTPVAETTTASRPPWLMWVAGAAALLLTIAVLLLGREYLKPPAAVGAAARTSVMLPEGLQFPPGNTLGGVGRFAISPNGKRLVMVGVDSSGNQMLWLRPLDSLTATPLAGTVGGSSPFWSPDSDTIAFFAQGQLKAVTLPGGDTRVIASPAYNATGAWSGDTILFTPTPNSPIARVAANGGSARTVTVLDEKAGDVIHRSPYFLPDGRHFLYVAVARRTGGTTPRAIYVGSVDGDQPHLVTENGSSAKYSEGYLVFLRENTLVAQPFDPAKFTLSGDPQRIATQVELSGVASATFSFSQTGGFVYQTESDGSQLVWVDRQGRNIESVGEPGRYGDLELSPDASQVAMSVLDPSVNTRDIWVMDLARGVRTRLTSDRAEDLAPIWSLDGTRIVFASNRKGSFDLYQKAASGIGTEEPIVTDQGSSYPASFAPDGALLFWSFAGGLKRLVEGKPPEEWLGGASSQAAVSRDGKWVLYVSNESNRQEVYVTGYPSPSWRAPISIAGGNTPHWRADGREAFYAGRDNKLMAVKLTPRGSRVEVEEAHPLFEVRPVSRGPNFAPAPDGQKFLVNTLRDPTGSASVTFVQNWSSTLQR